MKFWAFLLTNPPAVYSDSEDVFFVVFEDAYLDFFEHMFCLLSDVSCAGVMGACVTVETIKDVIFFW